VGDWVYLGRELLKRTRDPVKHVPFVIYVFLAIVMFGGLGIWIEILKIVISKSPVEFFGLITSVITFFPTLIGSTTLQLVLLSANKGDKILMSFSLLILCVFLAFAILLPFFAGVHPVRVLVLGVACSICAVWVWWFTNGDDSTFQRMPQLDSATGGSTNRNLPGDLNGFAV
jgi:hypothetical protein